jgi:hypothetical protein
MNLAHGNLTGKQKLFLSPACKIVLLRFQICATTTVRYFRRTESHDACSLVLITSRGQVAIAATVPPVLVNKLESIFPADYPPATK